MALYRGCWRRLQRYFAARGAEELSLDVAMAWVDDACGFFAKEQAGTLKQADVYMFRVATSPPLGSPDPDQIPERGCLPGTS